VHRYLLHKRKTKRRPRTHARVNEWGIECISLFTIRTVECPTVHERG
jgi:hypothetical protein